MSPVEHIYFWDSIKSGKLFNMLAVRGIVSCGCQSLTNLVSFARVISSSSVVSSKYSDYRSVLFHNRLVDLPIRPKRPKSAFLIFKDKLMDDIKKQHPSVPYKDLLRMLSDKWRKLDENTKQSYIDAVKDENNQYFQQLTIYKSNLSEEQKLALKDQLLRKKRRRFQTPFKKLSQMLGKPKRPTTSFALFVEEKCREPSSLPFKDRQKKWLIEWRNKPLIFKEKYRLQHAENMKKYRSDLEKWKESLIHLDQSGASEESKLMKTLKKVLEDTLYQNVSEVFQGEDEKLMRSLREKLIGNSKDIDNSFQSTVERNKEPSKVDL